MSDRSHTDNTTHKPALSQLPESSAQESLADIDVQLLALLGRRVQWLQGEAVVPDIWEQATAATAQQHAAAFNLPVDAAADWLMHAASLCARACGKREPIAYLGPIYSYSYLAAVKHFGQAGEFVPVTTIAAAFEEIARGQAHFAVVPIENSTDGRIVDTLGRFARSPAQICGEVLLPVHHCLLGRCRRADVREVQSKPQALSQCRTWLAQHLPDAKLVEVSSTAAAAATAATVPGVAAIASLEAGIHHGCEIIDANIEDNQHNITRFAIIGNRKCEPTGADKTSLMIQLKHQPGALANAMAAFQNAEVNLTWIESFPLPERPNEYLFFIELEGHAATPRVAAAIDQLRSHTERLDLLGSYPRGLAE
jgi:chorismate mutase/prephenate dehydratase